MPAPQASAMQQLARLKFTSFSLKVPTDWQDPSGDPGASHYGKAFQQSEKMTAPGMPPLFQPATMNKYHTDTQKMHVAKYGAYIDGICSAICSAWDTWQKAASMAGILVNAITASLGQLVGPPLTPLILASGPMASPQEIKYTTAIAQTIGTAWLSFTGTVKIPGLPLFPLYAALALPMAIPAPSPIPLPFAALTQVPASISASVLKMQMVSALGDMQAPYHKELFEAVSDAFEKCYNIWKVSTMVTVQSLVCPVPTFAPPYVPVGPVVGGTAAVLPGGLK